jgi:hypothetical protein
MCDGTLLPHCGHLFSCEACQRFAALRMRNRIFDVLRFGTPMAGAYKSITASENKAVSVTRSEIELQRSPERFRGKARLSIPWRYTTVTFAGSFDSGSLRSG